MDHLYFHPYLILAFLELVIPSTTKVINKTSIYVVIFSCKSNSTQPQPLPPSTRFSSLDFADFKLFSLIISSHLGYADDIKLLIKLGQAALIIFIIFAIISIFFMLATCCMSLIGNKNNDDDKTPAPFTMKMQVSHLRTMKIWITTLKLYYRIQSQVYWQELDQVLDQVLQEVREWQIWALIPRRVRTQMISMSVKNQESGGLVETVLTLEDITTCHQVHPLLHHWVITDLCHTMKFQHTLEQFQINTEPTLDHFLQLLFLSWWHHHQWLLLLHQWQHLIRDLLSKLLLYKIS